ncbi:SRPBCC family protein [Portibacter marinus]|uniref:SRPBCC family protein n=1 Tax=Portibacter marinus TaxID=2898660 RepID=UPI001F1B14CB|nr:SRPBCC family protein [Portibacter marinus]
MGNKLKISATIDAPLKEVWEKWTQEAHIIQWNFATDEWHCPSSNNDLRVGGKFNNRMEAKDGSFGFDLEGVYTAVEKHQLIAYDLADQRHVEVHFTEKNDQTIINSTFEAEDQNSEELQQNGWQAILNNFKNYVEHR